MTVFLNSRSVTKITNELGVGTAINTVSCRTICYNIHLEDYEQRKSITRKVYEILLMLQFIGV